MYIQKCDCVLKDISGTLVKMKETVSLCTHQYPPCSFMYKGAQMAFFCSRNWIFIYTRIHNGMLCTQECKAQFIMGIVEASFICFGYSHHTLT